MKKSIKNLTEAQDTLLEYEAKDLAKEQIAAAHFVNRSIQQLQKLARFITQENPTAVALLVADNLDKIQFVAARGSEQTHSMKDISAVALPLIKGKGGGNDALVQGGGEKITTPEALLEAMKAVLV